MSQNKETLFITQDLLKTIFFVKDSKNNLIGRFITEQEAIQWINDNGYKYRITYKKDVDFK